MKNTEPFVFTENLVFESVLYKGTLKIPFLFEIFLCLYQFHFKGYLIPYIFHIAGKHMIESGIDGLPRVNNLGGTMRGLKPLQFVYLGQGAVERSDKLEPWMRYWWGETLDSIETSHYFEEDKRGDNLIWSLLPAVMETTLELLLEDRLKRPHKKHLVVVPD